MIKITISCLVGPENRVRSLLDPLNDDKYSVELRAGVRVLAYSICVQQEN
jgi:hypothetical protein